MINFDFSKDCCGCGACADACSLGCISIIKDKKDFRIPHVETSKCVECGKCEKVCPVINPNCRVNDEQKLYCTYNNKEEIREKGSSGSIFYEVAKMVISEGGVALGSNNIVGLRGFYYIGIIFRSKDVARIYFSKKQGNGEKKF